MTTHEPASDTPTTEEMHRRADGWANTVTGMGTSRDKTQYGFYTRGDRVSDEEITALFTRNAIAKKIVRTLPRMVRAAGFTVTVLDAKGKEDSKASKAVRDEAKRLGASDALHDGMVWGRQFGGAGLLVMTASGNLAAPLNVEDPGAVRSLTVFDRRYLRVVSMFADPSSPNYGKPEFYELQPEPILRSERSSMPTRIGYGQRIHASRIIRFMGDEVDRLELHEVDYWSHSVLQTIYDNLRAGDGTVQSLGALLQEASISVFRLQGLTSALSTNQRDKILERIALTDLAKSQFRSIILDADREAYDRVTASLTGASDTASIVLQHVAAAAEMPMTVLFGISPAGMNATGESDMKNWHARAGEWRTDEAAPRIEAVYNLIRASLGFVEHTLEITYGTFAQSTAKEEADLGVAVAQRDKLYVEMAAVEPEAVSMARFGSGKYDPNAPIPVDVAALRRALKPQPVSETPPAVELTPSALESIVTMRMGFAMLNQPIPENFPPEDLDLSVAAKRAKDAAAQEAAAAPAPLPALPGV